MNLGHNPDLLDQLAASYALGTLRGRARRRFESQARSSAAVRAHALLWQERFSAMVELQPGDVPSPNVWKRIENLVAAEPGLASPAPVPQPLAERLRRALGWWRGAAVAGALATVTAVVVGVQLGNQLDQEQAAVARAKGENVQLAQANAQLRATPEVRYVAVLADEKSAASLLATYDPRHSRVTVQRVGDWQTQADHSLQLWAVQAGGVKSMGVLGAHQVQHMPMPEAEVGGLAALAVSLEPKGGTPGPGPTGPILFKGQLLRTAL